MSFDLAAMVDLERTLSALSTTAYEDDNILFGDTLRAAFVRVHEVVEALMVSGHEAVTV